MGSTHHASVSTIKSSRWHVFHNLTLHRTQTYRLLQLHTMCLPRTCRSWNTNRSVGLMLFNGGGVFTKKKSIFPQCVCFCVCVCEWMRMWAGVKCLQFAYKLGKHIYKSIQRLFTMYFQPWCYYNIDWCHLPIVGYNETISTILSISTIHSMLIVAISDLFACYLRESQTVSIVGSNRMPFYVLTIIKCLLIFVFT